MCRFATACLRFPVRASPLVPCLCRAGGCGELLETSVFLLLVVAELFFDRGNFYDFTSLGKKPGRFNQAALNLLSQSPALPKTLFLPA